MRHVILHRLTLRYRHWPQSWLRHVSSMNNRIRYVPLFWKLQEVLNQLVLLHVMICRSVDIFLIFLKAFLRGEESSSNRKTQQLLFYASLKTLPPLIDFKTTFHTLFQLVDFFLYPPRPFRLFILLYKFLVRDHLRADCSLDLLETVEDLPVDLNLHIIDQCTQGEMRDYWDIC